MAPTDVAAQPSNNSSPHIQTVEDDHELGRVESIDLKKDNNINDARVDREVAEYAGAERIVVDEKTSKRLKRMIDRRVLCIMVVTYFMQALDKGTISFVSIMNFNEDNNLVGQQVSKRVDEVERSLPRY